MHSNAAAGLLPELQLQQVQPIIHDLIGGRSSIVEWPILQKEERRKKEMMSVASVPWKPKQKKWEGWAAGKEKCCCSSKDTRGACLPAQSEPSLGGNPPPPNLNLLHNKNQNKKQNKTIAWYTGGENPEQWKKKKKTTFVLVWNIRSHDEVRSVNSPEPGFPLSPPGWHHRWPHRLSQPWWLHIFSTPVITCHRIYERKRQTRLLKLPQDTKVGRHVKIPTKRSENEFADVCKH